MKHIALWMGFLALIALPLTSSAQYRWTDAEGKVNYGDEPPPNAKDVQRLSDIASDKPSADPALPYELRLAVERFPVTLYTTAKCAPCDLARSYLRQRGVPYTERTVDFQHDVETLKSKGLGTDLPIATVGRNVLRGFLAETWTQELNAAGYPEQSKLPPNWKPAAPQPLTESPASLKGEAAKNGTDPNSQEPEAPRLPKVRHPFGRTPATTP